MSTVFMKHLRTKNIESLEQTQNLKGKFIINGIYQLKYINRDESFLNMINISIPSSDKTGFQFSLLNFKVMHNPYWLFNQIYPDFKADRSERLKNKLKKLMRRSLKLNKKIS